MSIAILVVVGASSSAGALPADNLPVSWISVRTQASPQNSPSEETPSLSDLGYKLLPVPAGIDQTAYAKALRDIGLVTLAEPDVQVAAAETVPADPLYSGYQASYLQPLGAEAAWDLATGRENVVIALLDTGVDLNHPDLQGRLWTNNFEIPANGVDDDGNGCVDDVYGCRFVNLTQERASACGYSSGTPDGAVMDDHGKEGSTQHSHGTITAGIAGARGNNGQGVAGVAWNIHLMPVKVLDCGVPSQGGAATGDLTNVAQGIDYARRMGADIINVSLSTRDDVSDLAMLRDAVQAAQADGLIIVAAAGNHTPASASTTPGFPAAYGAESGFPSVIAVGAADNTNGNRWAPYSNYGPALDFAAPGNGIASTARTDLALGTGYAISGQGTSYATPMVSGMFALMMSRNSGLAAADYIRIARTAATPPQPAPNGQNWAGSGVIHLGRAVALLPLAVTGVAMHDWQDVDAGSTVVATIGGTICGQATVVHPIVATFGMLVESDAEMAGCGAPGRAVQFLINGLSANKSITWGGKNTDLNALGLELSTVSPPPGPIVIHELSAGWNNLAHLSLSGSPPSAFSYLPSAWEELRVWSSDGGAGADASFKRYNRALPAYANDPLEVSTYDAFWVFLDEPATVAIANPNPAPGRTVALRAGWNNVVYTGTSRSVKDALADVDGLYTIVAQLDNATGEWLMHSPDAARYVNDFGGLMRLSVYWVYMTKPAILRMR